MMPMDNTKFINWLNRELERREWSQAELHRRSGIPTPTIARVLNGDRNAGPDFCISLARTFKISPTEIFCLAGILPEDYCRQSNPRADEVVVIMTALDEVDQLEIVDYARHRLRASEQRAKYKVRSESI